ncbi:ANP1/MMN9/VAN1 family protein [Paenibacillus sp. 1781tsa1]|uniref:ANP1/MMN9/VAN1 family protein n=1 Tax=Paenibacillus sp. 1781tsa1 TaxID=2953810 RepID=UPI00209C7647|nr:ANP1/MMN9/VAN1 family protein [Paenibacillus sp. 1781tsa1]MCP1185091.1 ANP1/MMN9/VAN1 family protein [Paenibacillus sp. 1781tsa1]
MKTITIAAPVRNREWILPQYLLKIFEINYPKSLIDLHFVVNDSLDRTFELLTEFKKGNKGLYNNIRIDVINNGTPEDEREFTVRNKHIYKHLSNLKNYIMTKTRTDKLIFIDTDILVESDVITKLLKHGKKIISALIYNGYLTNKEKPYMYPNIMQLDDKGQYRHITNYHVKTAPTLLCSKLQRVDLTGAVILLDKSVYKSIKYGFHPQGEDAYFCKMAQDNGFELFCDLFAYSQHIMSEQQLREFMNEAKNDTLLSRPELGIFKATSTTDPFSIRT